MPTLNHRVIFIGMEASGKTQLLNKLKDKPAPFESVHKPTLGTDRSALRDIKNNQKLNVWDAAGCARDQSSNAYMESASILVFALSCDKNFDVQLVELKARKETLANEVTGFQQKRKLLVFTKLDGENKLSAEQLARAKSELEIEDILTCSAKENTGIQAVKDKLFSIANEIDQANKLMYEAKLRDYNTVALPEVAAPSFFDRHIKSGGFWANHKTAFKVLSFATLGMFFGLYKLSMYLENRKVPTVSMVAHGSTTSRAMGKILGNGNYSQVENRKDQTFSAANSFKTIQVGLDSSQSQDNNCFRKSNRR